MLNIFKNKVVNNICYVVMIMASLFLFNTQKLIMFFNLSIFFDFYSPWHLIFFFIFLAGLVLRKYRDKLKNILSVSSLMVVFFSGQKFMSIAYANEVLNSTISINDISFQSYLTFLIYLIFFLIIVIAAFGINYMLFLENGLYLYSNQKRNIKDCIIPVVGVLFLVVICALKLNTLHLDFEHISYNSIIMQTIFNALFILLLIGYYAIQFLFNIKLTDKFLFASILTTTISILLSCVSFSSDYKPFFSFISSENAITVFASLFLSIGAIAYSVLKSSKRVR